MAQIPKTSISLIRAVSDDLGSNRWTELYSVYEPSIRDFLRANYPSLEADDVVQEAMLALAKALPTYRYLPDEHGHFRNYLLGIVKHKAMDALARRSREAEKRSAAAADIEGAARRAADGGDDEETWRAEALEVAIAQLMADAAIDSRNREIFRHVALMRERPDDVASQFGVTRNNVDQIKNRMLKKLADLVAALTA